MKLPSIQEVLDRGLEAFKRFPLTLIWAITGTIYVMYLIGSDRVNNTFDENLDIVLTLILGVSWFIGTQFFIEQQAKHKTWQLLKILILIGLGGFYFYLSNTPFLEDNPIYLAHFFIFLIAGHLFVLFAPFLKEWNTHAYWNYLKCVGIALTRSLLYSFVLYLGLVLALLAIDALFEITIRGERYGQLFVFSLGIVNTWIYLSDFPAQVRKNSIVQFERALEVLVKFILIPLIMLYLVILYAYFGKILLEWELPKGWVSYLVTVLALLGFMVHIIINPIIKTSKAWTIKRFYPWFYYLLLPLLVLLFVAIYRRVSDYGITENRYYVLLAAFWILGISLYMLCIKKAKLIVLPISLFLILMITAIGPWGAFSISKKAQAKEFKEVYNQVLLQDTLANYDQYQRLESILKYLDKRESLDKLSKVTQIDFNAAILDSTNNWKNYRWLNTRLVLDSLHIKMDSTTQSIKRNYNQYHMYDYGTDKTVFPIKDYDYFISLRFNRHTNNLVTIDSCTLSYTNKHLGIMIKNQEEDSMAVIPLKGKLLALTKYGNNLDNLPLEEKTITVENNVLKVKLVPTNLSYSLIEKDSIQLNNIDGYLFLKWKQDVK